MSTSGMFCRWMLSSKHCTVIGVGSSRNQRSLTAARLCGCGFRVDGRFIEARVREDGYYCPAWNWAFGAPLQMASVWQHRCGLHWLTQIHLCWVPCVSTQCCFPVFTPEFGWNGVDGLAPISVWAVPVTLDDETLQNTIKDIEGVLANMEPRLTYNQDSTSPAVPVPLHGEFVVRVADQVITVRKWMGTARALRVRRTATTTNTD